jgi:hypothetical protein
MARSYRKLVAKLAPKPVSSAAPTTMGKKSTSSTFSPAIAPPAQLNFADPGYIGALAQGNLPFDQALARLPGDVGSLATQYGYSTSFTPGQIDPATGLAGDPNIQVTGIDTSNPYSRAALLQRSFDQTKAGNTNSYAARGQLYAGSLNNAQGAAQTNFNTSSDQLRGQFNEQVRQWLTGLGGARLGAGAARTGALGDLVQRSLQDPVMPTAPAAAPVPVAPKPVASFAQQSWGGAYGSRKRRR